MSKEDFPEISKIKDVQEKYFAICDFFKFIEDKKLFLAKYVDPLTSESIGKSHILLTDLVDEFFGIDHDKLNQEKTKLMEIMSSNEK